MREMLMVKVHPVRARILSKLNAANMLPMMHREVKSVHDLSLASNPITRTFLTCLVVSHPTRPTPHPHARARARVPGT
jgi:hypothetical protein